MPVIKIISEKEVDINGESLEALAMLANSRRPMCYGEFVCRPERNLLNEVLNWIDLGLVQRVDGHKHQLIQNPPPEGYNERASFYELTEKGRAYFDDITGYASRSLVPK